MATAKAHTLADTSTLMRRMWAAVPEPALDDLAGAIALRLAGRTLTGSGVATAAILALGDRITADRDLATEKAWRQTLLLLKACLSDAPTPIQIESLDHVALVVLLSSNRLRPA